MFYINAVDLGWLNMEYYKTVEPKNFRKDIEKFESKKTII